MSGIDSEMQDDSWSYRGLRVGDIAQASANLAC
jgi:hypothetical protein